VRHAKPKGRLQRTPRPLTPDQVQSDRQEVREGNLDSGLVRAGKRQAVPSASDGFSSSETTTSEPPFAPVACLRRPFLLRCKLVVGFWVHRLTAKLLLLFGVLGNIVPLVQAAIPAPPHACCLRKATHHCHESSDPDSSRLVIRGTSCCGHECCRAVTTAHWAYPQPRGAGFSKQAPCAWVAQQILDSPATKLSSFQSSRAPPRFTIG
jgi:hypothetical protein